VGRAPALVLIDRQTGGVTDLSRYDDVLAWIDDLGERDEDVRACWIGGSVATGGYDDHSDLDINVLAAPGTFTEVYARLADSLTTHFSPTSLWELPEATYADGRQLFATFDADPGALDGPTRLLDVVVHEPTDEHRHVDVRRHGTPLVRFDPDGLVVLRHDDETDLRRGAELTIDQVRQRRLVAEWLVNRAVARRHLPEAVSLYLRFALLPVIQLLRARDCPARHDYMFRYLHTDLRPDDAARIDTLLPGVERLRELSAECFAWQDELLRRGPRPGVADESTMPS
jgi:predicted nucleotidyltransferase